MVAGGVPIERREHLRVVADFAIALLNCVDTFNDAEGTTVQVKYRRSLTASATFFRQFVR